jgi:hypothetical protein
VIRMRTRVAAAVGAALTLSVLPATAAEAHGGGRSSGHDVLTRAVAEVHRDFRTVTDVDFDVRRPHGRVDSATNLAVAYAQCTGCRSLSVAFQVVLVRRPAADLGVVNRAVGVTDRCVRCQALAYAYQWVVVTRGSLTPAGRWKLARLEHRLRLLVRSRPSADALRKGVEALAARVGTVLASEIRTRPAPRILRSAARR